jgi:hypothetical protein
VLALAYGPMALAIMGIGVRTFAMVTEFTSLQLTLPGMKANGSMTTSMEMENKLKVTKLKSKAPGKQTD